MKKLFIFISVLAVLAGCSQNETVKQSDVNTISFSNAFIDNATRSDATITLESLTAFSVWGHYSTTPVFSGVTVTKQADGTWTYADKKEWMQGESYCFHAFAPLGIVSSLTPYPAALGAKGLPVISFTNEGDKDFIYATAERDQPLEIHGPLNTSAVSLSFVHLLSRVKFTFKNNLSTNTNITIEDIFITDAGWKANIDLNQIPYEWTAPTASSLMSFGDTESIGKGNKKESGNVMFMIPEAARDFEVTFTINYDGNTLSKTATVNLELKMGYSYNLTATIEDSDINPVISYIEFDVAAVEGWAGTTDTSFDID